MAAGVAPTRTVAVPERVDALEQAFAAPAAERRDLSLDLLRGLAMVVLVVNHVHLESFLEDGTRALISAAEVLVLVSGVVSGMVFGRRWLLDGPRETTLALLRRARKLYLASVVVVALVGALSLIPGLATDVLAISPRVGVDSYAYDGALRTALAIVTLEAGPWQFNILGFFVAILALAPLVLWALARGWWPAVVALSAGLYVAGRALDVEVLPSQSERAFPILVWQLLFVGGMVVGWHRNALRRRGRWIAGAVLVAAAGAAWLRLWGPAGGDAWAGDHFAKTLLDPLRVAAMVAFTGALYLLLRRCPRPVASFLAPLGCNSFYVFIMHVFVCLAVATLAREGFGTLGNAAFQIGCLGLLWLMVRQRFLFRWVPR